MRLDARIPIGGTDLGAWHYASSSDRLADDTGRPCVVMVHGLGCTRDSGLEPFAEAFADAGADVLLFDPRGLGDSGGEPRQRIDPAAQRADIAAAIAHARSLEGVSPERIVAWGASFSGGHVLQVAAEDPRLAAVVLVTPAADGLAALRSTLARNGVAHGAKLTAAGQRDLLAGLRGRARVTVPIAGSPDALALISTPHNAERMLEIAGPTWRNEVCADLLLKLGTYRPGRHATKIACPAFVHCADADELVPPASVMWAARRARAEVRHLPCDHLDLYPGGPQHERAIEHQVAFLERTLSPR